MKAPTSRFGCYFFDCVACHGDKEWQDKQTLKYIREQLRNENMSYEELAELQDLADSIDAGDVELLEAAGVPEFSEGK